MNPPTSDLEDPKDIPPALLKRLDPEFRDFVLSQPAASRTPLHTLKWSSELREVVNSNSAGMAEPVLVGATHTISLGQFSARIVVPAGKPSEGGWPVLVYAHGGGWLFGSTKTGESFYTRLCTGKPVSSGGTRCQLTIVHQMRNASSCP
jgi:acetyl esterase/lipase